MTYRYKRLSSTYLVWDADGWELGTVDWSADDGAWRADNLGAEAALPDRMELWNKVYPTREDAAAALASMAESNGAGGKGQG